MAHKHIHHHSEGASSNILSAFFINLAFTVISLIGGWITNSMAIISDSIHDLGCTLSIALAWVFERIAGHKPTKRFTFGYQRFTLLGAFINAFILLSGSSIVLYESIKRLMSPEEVNAEGMLWFALLAILFKGLAVWRTWRGASVNQRMVSLHLLGDCLGWVAVLIASFVMMIVEIPLLDPILSVCISLYILYNVVHNLIVAFRIVLEGVPSEVDYDALCSEISTLSGIVAVSELRVWSLDNEHHVAELKATTTYDTLAEIEVLKASVRTLLARQGVQASTIELSPADSPQ
jgi:cobalt-zinc-cadmium efflux system protein